MPLISEDIATLRPDHKVVLITREEGHAGGVEVEHSRRGGGRLTDSNAFTRRTEHVEAPRAKGAVRAQCNGVVGVLRADHLHRIDWLGVGQRREGAALHWSPLVRSTGGK